MTDIIKISPNSGKPLTLNSIAVAFFAAVNLVALLAPGSFLGLL
jgi:hypothetical protein